MTPIRAVGLLSGGLDSALAAKLLVDQGIEVIGLHLEAPTACRSEAPAVAAELGIRLVSRPKGDEYLRLLRHPRYGHGRHMNPCVDCRIFMFELAQAYLEEFDAAFVFSGEVLGQRPMSQTKSSIELIDRRSGISGFILRPLSALLLPETEPEKRGWVDRSRLLGLSGRSRDAQLRLAREWGLTAHQAPGGGCLLTEPHFSRKLRDLFDHVADAETREADVALLKLGRHFRLSADTKIVLGRNAEENQRLTEFESRERRLIEPEDFDGPSALVCGGAFERAIPQAARLVVRYARVRGPCRVRWRHGDAWWVERVDADALASGDLPVAI